MDPEVKKIEGVEMDFASTIAGWKATLFNCECHTFAQVIEQIMKAVGCPFEEARAHTQAVHNTGSSVVYRGTKPECERVARVLGSIGLLADVSWGA